MSRFEPSGIIVCMSARADENMPSWVIRARVGRPRTSDDFAVAVEGLFIECGGRVGKYLVQLIGDRALAEDLLQDTFHNAFKARAQLSTVRNPEAWLFAIARNVALPALRRRRRSASAIRRLTRESSSSAADPELLALRDLLDRYLSADDRSLLLLRYLHGFNAAELAEMTGRSPAAVRQRLSRARSTLLDAATPQNDTA